MLIDFHTHIFPPHICKQRALYCRRDPWFSALYADPRARMATADELVAEMDASGVDASVAFSFGWTDPGLIEETNSYVIDAVRRFPGRIYGMAVIQPTAGTRAVRELERCAVAGMVGLGELIPHGQGYKLSDIELLAPLPFYCLMPEVQRVAANVWYDTAATIYLYRPTILPVVAQLVGADRILFASDYALLRQRRVIEHIEQSGLDQESRSLVLGGNAQRLLGI